VKNVIELQSRNGCSINSININFINICDVKLAALIFASSDSLFQEPTESSLILTDSFFLFHLSRTLALLNWTSCYGT